ncbi:MAG TPA: nitrile hydratase subunit alpha [Actinomycetota bacterium]
MSGQHASQPIAARVRHLEERLIQAGVLTDAQIDQALERFLATASPTNGARLAARAWVDRDFRELVLADANAALAELDLGGRGGEFLRVVANTATQHNVVVCTLCSCYPLRLLGPSPSWYKSEAYRARVVREPREVLAEFGLRLPPEMGITVWDSSAEARYVVLPRRPPATENLTEPDLARLVTRNGLIGTAEV